MDSQTGAGQSAICNLQSKIVLGLIGGMGSGKSLVAAELARHGGYVIAGDQLGHEALGQPEIKARVIERFGSAIVNGEGNIDRRRLGQMVFAAASARHALETLVFPYIESRIREEIGKAKKNPQVVFIVLDAAVMLEAGWNKHCDWLVYVDAPPAVRLERLARQRGLSETEVQARENAQWPLTAKAQRADFVVHNAGAPEDVARQVDDLLRQSGIVTIAQPCARDDRPT